MSLSLKLAWPSRLILSGALLALLLSRIEPVQLVSLTAGFSPAVLAALLGLTLFSLFLSAVKWNALLGDHSVSSLFRLTLVGVFYSMVLPGQLAGEVVKAYRLGKGRADAERVAASVLLDKVTGLVVVLLLGLAGAAFSPQHGGRALQVVAVAFAICVAGLFALRVPALYDLAQKALGRARIRFPRAERPLLQFSALVVSWREYLERPMRLAASIGIGVLPQLVNIFMIQCISGELGFSLPFPDWCWVFALVSVAVLVPISLGGLGVREGAFVGLLGTLGVAPEQALALSLTVFALQLVAALIGAVVEVVGSRRDR